MRRSTTRLATGVLAPATAIVVDPALDGEQNEMDAVGSYVDNLNGGPDTDVCDRGPDGANTTNCATILPAVVTSAENSSPSAQLTPFESSEAEAADGERG